MVVKPIGDKTEHDLASHRGLSLGDKTEHDLASQGLSLGDKTEHDLASHRGLSLGDKTEHYRASHRGLLPLSNLAPGQQPLASLLSSFAVRPSCPAWLSGPISRSAILSKSQPASSVLYCNRAGPCRLAFGNDWAFGTFLFSPAM